jgi:hypothetical protein
MKFANFTAGETPGQTLLADARGLLAALTSVNTEALMSMRVIVSFADDGRYDGIVTAFKRGDATVVGCTLDHLQQLVQKENDRLAVLNPTQPSAKRSKINPPTPTPPPDPSEDKPPPVGNMEVSYPPTSGIRWGALKRLIEADKQCPL